MAEQPQTPQAPEAPQASQTPQAPEEPKTPPQATQTPNTAKSSSGLEPNIAGALCYIPIVGIVFLIIEKNNKFIKFHAIQSILFYLATTVISYALGVTLILILLIPLLYLASFVVWIMLIVKAYGNEEWQLPIIGKIAKNAAYK